VAKDKHDRVNLEYLARGMVALKEVTVLCPLLRDSTQSKLKSLRVNFQRGLSQTLPGQSPPGGSVPFRGLLYSCSSTEHVSAANEALTCPFVSARPSQTGSSKTSTSSTPRCRWAPTRSSSSASRCSPTRC
jgi:hypothetical protein